MANLSKALTLVKANLSHLNKNSKANPLEYFYGIDRKYFPKWEGWSELDAGGTPSDASVADFYNQFFWQKLECNYIGDQHVANLLMAFAVISGKKKAISKLQRVLKREVTGQFDPCDIIYLNTSNATAVFLSLFSEITEFYISTNSTDTEIFITANISGGNSGGPLIDNEGKVVGTTSWGHKSQQYNGAKSLNAMCAKILECDGEWYWERD